MPLIPTPHSWDAAGSSSWLDGAVSEPGTHLLIRQHPSLLSLLHEQITGHPSIRDLHDPPSLGEQEEAVEAAAAEGLESLALFNVDGDPEFEPESNLSAGREPYLPRCSSRSSVSAPCQAADEELDDGWMADVEQEIRAAYATYMDRDREYRQGG